MMFLETLLDAFADDRFVALTNYGDRWGIKWKRKPQAANEPKNANIAEVFDKTLDRLCETFVEILEIE